MAAVAWPDVVDHYASLVDYDTHAGDDLIEYVNEVVNADAFGGEDSYRTKLARIHLAAHFALLGSTSGTAGGPVASRSVGDIAESFAVHADPNAYEGLTQTAGGRAYLALLRASYARVPVIV